MEERLQKILSAAGAASRREAERLIASGRVTVDGHTASLGDRADPGRSVIALDGVPIGGQAPRRYIMLHKPRGYVTTMKDEQGRRTVRDLTQDVGVRVYPVGRLDVQSEGLLLLTSDGAFANAVMHPRYEKEKVYVVSVSGYNEGALPVLRGPMELDGYPIRPAGVTVLRQEGDRAVLRMVIHEGRNRQIRKMCEKASLTVHRLQRTAIGIVTLGSLRPGCWRDLTEEERRSLAPSLFPAAAQK